MKKTKGSNPQHIAIILDGNRRYAKRLGWQPWKGHEVGFRKLEDLFKWSIELGINELTLYCFSTENFKRDKDEVNFLFDLFFDEFEKMKNDRGVFSGEIKVNVIGRTYMFSKKMQDAFEAVVKKTKNNRKLTVNFALAYGGRQEIIDAVNKIIKNSAKSKKPVEIDEGALMKNLYLENEPDIVIRPGGEVRTSNFLMWQSSYSEWFFLEKLWPEFTKKDLEWVIAEFHRRERRFGK